jgi:hypothetical protein
VRPIYYELLGADAAVSSILRFTSGTTRSNFSLLDNLKQFIYPSPDCWTSSRKQVRFTSIVCFGYAFNNEILSFFSHEIFVVQKADPTHKMKLAEIYEIRDELRKALELVYEGPSISYLQSSLLPLTLTHHSHRLP